MQTVATTNMQLSLVVNDRWYTTDVIHLQCYAISHHVEFIFICSRI